MILASLFLCLLLETALVIKLLFSSPFSRLNAYLAISPGLYVICTVIEINLYYITNEATANHIYTFYQYFAFCPLISGNLIIIEYIKTHTNTPFLRRWQIPLKALLIGCNAFWVVVLVITGPTATIYLSAPHTWTINFVTYKPLFLWHSIASVFWLATMSAGCIYLVAKSQGKKRKSWFSVLAFQNVLITAGVLYSILSRIKNPSPQNDFLISVPVTIDLLLQSWVLSEFTVFQVKSKNIYNEVLDSIDNWIIVTDDHGLVKFMNPQAMKSLSLDNFDHMGIDQLLCVHTAGQREPALQFLKSMGGHKYSEVMIVNKSSGASYNVQSAGKKIHLPDGTMGHFWVLIDNTQLETLKEQKKAIESTNSSLAKAYDDIVFLTDMTSHDLKTPLQTIIELAGHVEEENRVQAPNKAGEFLGYIRDVSAQSLNLVTNLIVYMKTGIQEKQVDYHPMQNILRLVQQRLVTKIKNSGTIIRLSGVPYVYADLTHITELLCNLIDNSISYRLHEPPLIEIEVMESGSQYLFKVKDNSKGMSPALLVKLKNPQIKKLGSGGSGLGLMICKKIVAANNGTISFRNNKEGGLTVKFTLAKGDAHAAPVAIGHPQLSEGPADSIY